MSCAIFISTDMTSFVVKMTIKAVKVTMKTVRMTKMVVRRKRYAAFESFKRVPRKNRSESTGDGNAGRCVQTDHQPDRKRGLFPIGDIGFKDCEDF